MKHPFLLKFVFVAAALLLVSCSGMPNYADPDGPIYTGEYGTAPADFSGTLKAVSYNIRFGENAEAASVALANVEELSDADVLLLQEMDEAGVQIIARTLGYNYVYIPASVHTRHQKDFGNAILARWPLSQASKIILPYANPKNLQKRTVTRALAHVADVEVLLYSVHTETFWMNASERHAQFDALVENADPAQPYVIVGGDFNTFTPMSIAVLDAKFEQAGMERASADAGASVKYQGLSFSLDHIYTRGLAAQAAGIVDNESASDHKPVWVDLAFP